MREELPPDKVINNKFAESAAKALGLFKVGERREYAGGLRAVKTLAKFRFRGGRRKHNHPQIVLSPDITIGENERLNDQQRLSMRPRVNEYAEEIWHVPVDGPPASR